MKKRANKSFLKKVKEKAFPLGAIALVVGGVSSAALDVPTVATIKSGATILASDIMKFSAAIATLDTRTNGEAPTADTDLVNKGFLDAAVSAAGDWQKDNTCADTELSQGYNADGSIKCKSIDDLGIGGGSGSNFSVGNIDLGDGANPTTYFMTGGSPNYCTRLDLSTSGVTGITPFNEKKVAYFDKDGNRQYCNNGLLGTNGYDWTNEPIQWKGLGYNTITSAVTGKKWLDRNLGSPKVCESATDSDCYGDYLQWGREYGISALSNSLTTTNVATGLKTIANKFIAGHSDWTTADSDGALRSAFWSKADGTGICPTGYRVPTQAEFAAENITSASDMFSKLGIPMAGAHRSYNDSLYRTGTLTNLWTSTGGVSYSRYLSATNTSTDAGFAGTYRSSAFSIRCRED